MSWKIRLLLTLTALATTLTLVSLFSYLQKPVSAKKMTISSSGSEAMQYGEHSESDVAINAITDVSAKVVSVIPSNDEKNVLLDIEDPIVVKFDRSMKEYFVDFRLDPSVEVAYENNESKTEFRLLPKAEPLPETTYSLSVYAKKRGIDDASYTLISSTRFTTAKAGLTKNQREMMRKLADVKKDTTPQIIEGKYIDISLTNQTMVIFENGQSLDSYLISSGKRGMDTPKGSFQVRNKFPRPWSKAYGLYMPYWMAITPDGKYGIHELPEWPGGYKEGANHLGIPVSHGCVRLGVGAAERVWNWAEVGTPIIIH